MADDTNISGPTFTPKNPPDGFLPQGPCRGLPLSPSLPLSVSPQLHLLDLALRIGALQPVSSWELVFSAGDLGLERVVSDYRPLVALPGSGTASVLSEGPSLSRLGDYSSAPSRSFFGVHNFLAASVDAFSRDGPRFGDVSVSGLGPYLGTCASMSLRHKSGIYRCVSVGDPSSWSADEPSGSVETVPAPESWTACADKFVAGHPFSSGKAAPCPSGFSSPPYDGLPGAGSRPSAWAVSHLPLSCYPEACAAFARALGDRVAFVACGQFYVSSACYDPSDTHTPLLFSSSVSRPSLSGSVLSYDKPDVANPSYAENKADGDLFCVRFASQRPDAVPDFGQLRMHALLEVKAYARRRSWRGGDDGGDEVCVVSDDVVAYLSVVLKPRDGSTAEWVLEGGVDKAVSDAHELVLGTLRAADVPLLGPKPPKASVSSEVVDDGDPPLRRWNAFAYPELTGRLSVGATPLCPAFKLANGFFDAAS